MFIETHATIPENSYSQKHYIIQHYINTDGNLGMTRLNDCLCINNNNNNGSISLPRKAQLLAIKLIYCPNL